MAELTRTWKWVRMVPNLGNNKELPNPFWLKVKSGLTLEERQAFFDRLEAMRAAGRFKDEFAAFVGEYVEMGDEPLVVKGKPIETMAEYLALLDTIASVENVSELIHAVRWANSVEGTKALFFEQLSGGGAFTTILPSERAATRTTPT